MTFGYHEKLLKEPRKEPIFRACLCRFGCHDVVNKKLKSDDIAVLEWYNVNSSLDAGPHYET